MGSNGRCVCVWGGELADAPKSKFNVIQQMQSADG